MKKYFKKYIVYIFLGQTCKLIEAILELLVPIIVLNIVDIGLKLGKDYINKKIILMFIIAVTGFFFAMICQVIAAKVSENISRDIRLDIIKKTQKIDYVAFDKYGEENIYVLLTTDVYNIQKLIAMFIRLFIRAPFLLIGAFVLCLIINYKLTLIIFILFLIVIIASIFIYKRLPLLYKKIQKSIEKIYNKIQDAYSGNKEIKLYGYKDRFISKYDKEQKDYIKENINVIIILEFFISFTEYITNLSYIFIILFGVILNKVDKGTVVAFIGYIGSIIIAFMVILNLLSIFFRGKVSLGRIKNYFLNEDLKYKTKSEKDFEIIYKLKNVNYSYNSKEVLENISFDIRKGDKIGIIGATSSGKTTLINLLTNDLRTKSDIYYKGDNINEVEINDICKIKQHSNLFSESLSDMLGYDDIKVNWIIKKLKLESIYDRYGFYEKIDVNKLSGGEKQRLNIAKALISDKNILIFDESFTAIDNVTEYEIIDYLLKLEKTIIIVSKKVKTIKNMDKIILLDKGKIIFIGSHKELSEKSELYREIRDSQ